MRDEVKLLRRKGEVIGLSINGKRLRSIDEVEFDARIEDVKDVRISSIPKGFIIGIRDVEGFQGLIFAANDERPTPFTLVSVEAQKSDWFHGFSIKRYFEALKQSIQIRTEHEHDVSVEEISGNNEGFDVMYSAFLKPNMTFANAIRHCLAVMREIQADTERILQKEDISAESLEDEEKFTMEVLLPLFRRMGFLDVHYNHGQKEFGKDITFSEIDKFNQRRNYGVQVKVGDISGRAKSDLNEAINQINEAFPHDYIDTSSRERRFISDFVIAISGHFTDKAKEKIMEEVRARNVHFFDIDKIEELLVKYIGKRIVRKT